MKKFTLIFLLIFGICFQLQAYTKTPKISFKELKHNFGKVKEGSYLNYSYEFKNIGNAKLIIESVNASCGCTGVTVGDKKEYDKNEKGKIKVSFNTRGREGKQTKSITVNTNDPDNPQIVLTFTCNIIKNK